MCNVPSFGDITDKLTSGLESAARSVGLTSDALGVPTLPQLTGAEEAKAQAKAQAEQQADFDRLQAEEEANRVRAAEERARGTVDAGRGRASTLLTGPGGVLDDSTSARRTLMGG